MLLLSCEHSQHLELLGTEKGKPHLKLRRRLEATREDGNDGNDGNDSNDGKDTPRQNRGERWQRGKKEGRDPKKHAGYFACNEIFYNFASRKPATSPTRRHGRRPAWREHPANHGGRRHGTEEGGGGFIHYLYKHFRAG